MPFFIIWAHRYPPIERYRDQVPPIGWFYKLWYKVRPSVRTPMPEGFVWIRIERADDQAYATREEAETVLHQERAMRNSSYTAQIIEANSALEADLIAMDAPREWWLELLGREPPESTTHSPRAGPDTLAG